MEEATKAKRVQQEINAADEELQRYAMESANKLEREKKAIEEVEAMEKDLHRIK